MKDVKRLQQVMQYIFRDGAILDEARTAARQDQSRAHRNTRGHSNRSLALIGDALLRLILVDGAVREGKDTCMLCLIFTTPRNLEFLQPNVNVLVRQRLGMARCSNYRAGKRCQIGSERHRVKKDGCCHP